MTYQTTSIRLTGALCGPIWWPVGAMCGKDIDIDLERERARMGGKASFRDLLLHVQMEHGGDFQGASFTAGTVIEVTRAEWSEGRRRSHTRILDVATLPGCDDLTDADTYSYDFGMED